MGSKKIFSYRFNDISSLDSECVLSPRFNFEDFGWAIRIYKRDEHLEVYLKCLGKNHYDSDDWSCEMKYQLQLLSKVPTKQCIPTFVKTTYNTPGVSYGHPDLIPWKELMTSSNGYLVDDSIVVKVELFGNNKKLEKSQSTGLIGMQEREVNTFVNPVLQSLFFIQQFCESIYKTPLSVIESEENHTEDVIKKMQNIFYRLQYSDQAVTSGEFFDEFSMTLEEFLARFDMTVLRAPSTRSLFQIRMTEYTQAENISYGAAEDTLTNIQLTAKNGSNGTGSAVNALLSQQ